MRFGPPLNTVQFRFRIFSRLHVILETTKLKTNYYSNAGIINSATSLQLYSDWSWNMSPGAEATLITPVLVCDPILAIKHLNIDNLQQVFTNTGYWQNIKMEGLED